MFPYGSHMWPREYPWFRNGENQFISSYLNKSRCIQTFMHQSNWENSVSCWQLWSIDTHWLVIVSQVQITFFSEFLSCVKKIPENYMKAITQEENLTKAKSGHSKGKTKNGSLCFMCLVHLVLFYSQSSILQIRMFWPISFGIPNAH